MKITDSALKHFKMMMEADKKDSMRIFVFKSCCSSMIMIDAEKGKTGDKLVKHDGVDIYIDPAAFDILADAEIDAEKGDFKIKGIPQNDSSCCG